MKRILLFLLLLSININPLHAQSTSNTDVIFIRHSKLKFGLSIYTHALMKNDSIKIGKLPMNSVLIHRTGSSAKYAMNIHKKQTITIAPTPDKVRIVLISPKFGFLHPKFNLNEISHADFIKLYKKKEWVRNDFKELGYNNVEEILN